MARNLFDLYENVRSNTLSEMDKASDLAAKMTDRSYQDANLKRKIAVDKVYDVTGLDTPVVSKDAFAATFAGEEYRAAGNKITEEVLNSSGFLTTLNNMGFAQYATGNNTFITGIKKEEVPGEGPIKYRVELGELEPGQGGPKLRFKALDTRKTDEKGDLLITEEQFGNLFEDFQWHVQTRAAPRVGTRMAYDYISKAPGAGDGLNVRPVQIPDGQSDPNGTNYGGDPGDPELANQAFTGNPEFKGNVLDFLESTLNLKPKKQIEQLIEGGADAVAALTDSEILKLEDDYGIPMKNANLGFYRDQINSVRAAGQTAQNTLDNKDLDLTDLERKQLENQVKFYKKREERIMGEIGDAGEFLAGGLNVTFAGAQSQDALKERRAEKLLFDDIQLKGWRRDLAKEQRIFENAPESEYKNQSAAKIVDLEQKILARENELDPREEEIRKKDNMNKMIATILENPDDFSPARANQNIHKLLKEANYPLSEKTKERIDNYIDANLVAGKGQNATVKLTDQDIKFDSDGVQTSAPANSVTGRSLTKVKSGIDNRAFSILLAMDTGDANFKNRASDDIVRTSIETMRYTGTLDTETFKAVLKAKENLSKAKFDAIKGNRERFLEEVAPAIEGMITSAAKFNANGDTAELLIGDEKNPFFIEYNKIHRNVAVQEIFNSADVNGKVAPEYQDLRNYLRHLDLTVQNLVARVANEEDFIEWIKGAGKLPDGFSTDALQPNAFRLKAVYADGASKKYTEIFNRFGRRFQDAPDISHFQLQSLTGEDLGGKIEYGDLVKALNEITDGVAVDPTTLINRFEMSGFTY